MSSSQDNNSLLVPRIKSTIEKSPSPQLYTMLADLHTEDEKTFDVAIIHYHDALKYVFNHQAKDGF